MIIDKWNPERRRYKEGNVLLRTSILLPIQAGSHPQGSGLQRHEL